MQELYFKFYLDQNKNDIEIDIDCPSVTEKHLNSDHEIKRRIKQKNHVVENPMIGVRKLKKSSY